MKQIMIITGLLLSVLIAIALWGGNSQDVYAHYDLEGLTTEEMIESLDKQTLDGSIISAGVLEREFIISHEDGEDSYPIDDDVFYLSFAPYINETHPCHNHNLVTCQSELAGETVDVFIETDDGDVLIDKEVTLYDNGFKGVWLPSDISGTITVDYEDKTVTAPLGTYSDSGTCMTEPLKLS